MNFSQAVDFLYSQLPMFQRVGAPAFKKDLSNTIFLLDHLGNPQNHFKTVHVAGTNGKGSSAHFIASILQCAGYKTGLYTSPHLKSFTERIRVDGKEVSENYVVEFVEKVKPLLNEVSPSFFEMTVAMAFDYFAKEKVDIAVVEVGLGGRLDSTNVINPEVSLITNISMDHTDLLGKTIREIAFEKAGIIKKDRPVVIGVTQPEADEVFINKASENNSLITFADQQIQIQGEADHFLVTNGGKKINIELPIRTNYILKNIPGVIQAIEILRQRNFGISDDNICKGLKEMPKLTGLKGRWHVLSSKPFSVCDVAHNIDGISRVIEEIGKYNYEQLHIVWGCAKDKDIEPILDILPKNAKYYFCQAQIPRAMKADELNALADKHGLSGTIIPDVNEAYKSAIKASGKNDFILVGGSTFVVAELENL